MPRPCRVLILNERDPRHPSAGGAEVHVSEIFGRLAKAGYEVEQLSSSFRGAARVESVEGVAVRRLGGLARYYPSAAWTCARETRAGRHDVVVECLNKLPFFSPLYAGVPVLALCHHLFGTVAFEQVAWPIAAAVWSAERFVPPVYRRCPFVTISESSRDDLAARGIPRERVRVSHCGIEPCRVPVSVEAARPLRVTYVGRLEPYKRVDLVVRAFALLAGRFPEAELLVIGRGSARAALEGLSAELGIGGRTRFAGFVDDEERDRLLAGSRVCACASPKEGWGLTVIEANAAGAPVVASDAPGLRDSVRHGETGLLVGEATPEAFADAMARVLADDALALRLSREALRWARHFDWDRAAEEMAEALEAARGARPR